MSISRFRELKAWQLGMDLAEKVYLLSESFPKSEIYGLTSQIRRAAVSIPSNLAEGHGRTSTKEFLQFIAISFGSICELETQILLSHRLKYITMDDSETVLALLTETSKTIRGLQRAIKDRLDG
ncbi:four helix bundle protein [Chamaesiphon minutus]|jgi:four helix bundle protein|uniref:S23 ribosomal protein n=1 Tax=Chamaesiphon minutus (strain ATCC 27169 / PCC 6605) TaxID=1173020 RepID=K9UJT0_CHAP6|nr:four helix bundle protein [Chamaesiphon minutus]AFY95337.1 S23 ribosomal protein [Chamaesiphon minutus PCC 6605]